ATNQIARERRESIVLTLGPPMFDSHVLALDIAQFGKTLTEGSHDLRPLGKGCGAEKPDHRHRPLLRPCRQRPSRRRAAEKGDELPPLHEWPLLVEKQAPQERKRSTPRPR